MKISRGNPLLFGATLTKDGVNFSISSQSASSCNLVLFKKNQKEPFIEIEFKYRVGNVFSMVVNDFDVDIKDIEYGYRFDNNTNIILDPYAKVISGNGIWNDKSNLNNVFAHRGVILSDDFNWEDDKALEIPLEDLIIYEMHLRGFTNHKSSNVKHKGSYLGVIEKIPYLKELGINAIELMPIFEFDELEYLRLNPNSKRLINYWGYSTIGFFAPKAGYSFEIGNQVNELKILIKELHKNGIEVILDVVFNHSAEGDDKNGRVISFKGIDTKIYYILDENGDYLNFSGCGNTLNCNHPIVRKFVLDSLRYWVSEYHIDGFRFDLASILGRDTNGEPHPNPPLLEALANDPILAKVKLIAEAWDAGGLYQVGNFPNYGRFAEWNGKYRDTIRKFLRGSYDSVSDLSQRIQGSPDLYYHRGPNASINFITSHDGFTLKDLFTYNHKQNFQNGENSLDGDNNNFSDNCGIEGETNNIKVNRLRVKKIKNALSILMISRGIPMLLMGDEMGRSQNGNNNAYCHDTPLTWLNWDLININSEIFRFSKLIIKFRNTHPVLRSEVHFKESDISLHGVQAWESDLSGGSRTFAFMLCENSRNYIYVAMNMHSEDLKFELPQINNINWYLAVNTVMQKGEDIFDIGEEKLLKNQNEFIVKESSIIILIGCFC